MPSHTWLRQHRSFPPSSRTRSRASLVRSGRHLPPKRFLPSQLRKNFPPRAKNVNDAGAEHSFLSITFLNCAHCMVCGVLSAYLVISSFPMASSRLGSTDMYDGDAHIKWSSTAWRCAFLWPALLMCRRGPPLLLSTCSSPSARHAANPPGILTAFLWRVHFPFRSRHRHVGFHLLLVRSRSREVKEETFANPDTLPSQQLRQSVYFVASAIAQCSVQLGFQRHSSSCGLSCPPCSEPVPCVHMLFREVSQVPVYLPELSHLFSADCVLRNQLASQRGEWRLCIIPLGCAA